MSPCICIPNPDVNNSIIVVPEQTKAQQIKAASKEIRFENTRLTTDPFKKPAAVDKVCVQRFAYGLNFYPLTISTNLGLLHGKKRP